MDIKSYRYLLVRGRLNLSLGSPSWMLITGLGQDGKHFVRIIAGTDIDLL